MRWLFCNTWRPFIGSRWLMGKSDRCKKMCKKVKHTQSEMQRDIMENEETEKENGSEAAVQQKTFNYFVWPQANVLNFLNVMAIKKGLSVTSKFAVGLWDGLEVCEISLPELLSQSCPVLHGGCSVMIHSLANDVNVSYFELMCQYDVRSSDQRDTKLVNGYFILKYMSGAHTSLL